MTDGILLRECARDLLLRRYSVVILDEAHERSLNTDVLVGLISRTVELRRRQSAKELEIWNQLSDEKKAEYQPPIQPIKVIIMSATLTISDFQNNVLFPNKLPPVIRVDARQYPVTVHFAKQTVVSNYLNEAYKRVVQIHRRLPPGGILVFLTGKREIQYMIRKLKKKLSSRKFRSQQNNLEIKAENAKEDGAVYDINEDMGHDTDGDEDDSSDNKSLTSDGNEYENDNDEDGLDDDESDEDESDDDFNTHDGTLIRSEAADEITDSIRENNTNLPNSSMSDENYNMESQDVRAMMLRSALGFDINQEFPKSLLQNELKSPSTSYSSTSIISDVDYSSLQLRPIILPLHAMLSTKQQNKIFKEFPPNRRLIVVATNVAETSITIPGIRYVVDCGRQKECVRLMPSGIRYLIIC
jgi:ATP-dependent RNA helicase DHX37/DHR1